MKQLSRNWSALGLVATFMGMMSILAMWVINNAPQPVVGSPITAVSPMSGPPIISAPMTYNTRCVPLSDAGSTSGLLVFGNAYFVSTGGDNGNQGTIDQPWRTIQYAVNHVKAGDAICVRAGTYFESIYVTGSGTQEAPIVLSTYNGEVTTINGGKSSAIRSPGNNEDYWEIHGLTLESNGRYTLEMGNWDCVNATDCHGSSHWAIRNTKVYGAVFINGSYNLFETNEVDGSRHTGDRNGVLEVGLNSHHNTYRNNEVHDFRQRGFWSESFTHDSLWEGNHVHDIWGDDFSQGIDLDGYKNVEWRHKVRGNRIERVSGLAIQLENTFASLVENNVIESPRRQGIVVINYPECQVDRETHQYGGDNCVGAITNNILRQNLIFNGIDWGGIISYQAGGIQILGNTIARTKGPCIDLRGQGTTPQIALRNNILSCGSTAVSMDALSSFVEDGYNLLDPLRPAYEVRGGRRYSLAQYREATGQGQGSMQIDPLFVNASANDFHLQPGSPAVDTGTEVDADTDLAGTPRPQGSGYDIGALEFTP